jgi:hypothetical protein
VRPPARTDRRPLGVFLLVLLAGVAVLAWAYTRPVAEADPGADAGTPPAVAQGTSTAPAPTSTPAPSSAQPDLEPVAADGPIVPTRIRVPAIGVDTVVESRGTVSYENPFTGEQVSGYDVPDSMATTSWWHDGPKPGSGQMAVVLGHAQTAGPAVFNRLHELRPGDTVTLTDASGAVLTLRVLGEPRTGLDKASPALAEALNGHPAEADLALVTCGGEFDPDAGASEDNTVVFADVVEDA